MATMRWDRHDVLEWAGARGWELNQASFDDGFLLRDRFERRGQVVRVVWIRTPWTGQGRFAGAVLSDLRSGEERNIWTLGGQNSLMDLLGPE